ncbi:MAG: hypothetical protein SNJ78_02935 [Spirochaetales bacterium]
MASAFLARLFVAVSAIVITFIIVGIFKLAEKLWGAVRKPKVTVGKAVLSNAK